METFLVDMALIYVGWSLIWQFLLELYSIFDYGRFIIVAERAPLNAVKRILFLRFAFFIINQL